MTTELWLLEWEGEVKKEGIQWFRVKDYGTLVVGVVWSHTSEVMRTYYSISYTAL